MLSLRGLTIRLTFLVFVLSAATMAQSAHKPGHYITGPAEGSPEQIVLDYIYSDSFARSFSNSDLSDIRLNKEVPSANGKITHLYFDQYLNGIQIYRGIFNATVKHDGRIISLGDRLVKGTQGALSIRSMNLSATDALAAAANHLGASTMQAFQQVSAPDGNDLAQMFAGGQLSYENIPARLQYIQIEGDLRLSWFFVIRHRGTQDWWEMHVDAQTGKVIHQHNYTIYDHFPNNAFSGHLPASSKAKSMHQILSAKRGISDGSAYFGLPLGIESPNHGALELISEPADPVASPFGWHDTDGVEGPEFTITRGNNVHAYPDRDNRTFPQPDSEPEGGAALQFNVVPDLEADPETYTDAATINLFIWNNFAHDLMVHYGFDEASGNFQATNYSGQGSGNDHVFARAQSGGNVKGIRNNATFGTSPDGSSPLMSMFEFVGPADFVVVAPSNIAGQYDGQPSSFGFDFPGDGIAGTLQLADDGAGATTGCTALSGFTAGNIALIDRGDCEFGVKVLNAENAGAVAAIVINNQGDDLLSMGPGQNGDQVDIPSLFVGQTTGNLLRNAILGGATVNVTISGFNRDSDFDAGIIMHEYGHGISNRLVGGPGNTSCLSTGTFPEQAGEGWSDFYGLVFTHGDGTARTRGVGTYPSFQETTGPGIREFPYSDDMEINPVTYDKIKDIDGTSQPHGVGHVLNTALWDMYLALVDEVGFDPDLYTGTGGNNIAIMLVTEALKIVPCGPTFVDYRDALLAADLALYDGQFNCLIWTTLARRGLGENADGGSATSRTDGTEDFTVPANCLCSPAAITGNPQDATQCAGTELTLTVTATGTDLTYQWYRNGQIVVGQTSASMVIASSTAQDSGDYTCVVSNGCSEVTSTVAEVFISEPVAFDNASFARWGDDIGCGDANSNGVLDILDLSALAPLTPLP